MNRKLLHVLMAAASADGAQTGAAGAAPTSNVEGVAATVKTRAPKNPDNILDIVNGRLPLPLVFLIRFKEEGTTAERAKRYGTSVGKVFDIQKNRNFGYVDASYKPSADEVKAAKDWFNLKTHRTQKTLTETLGADVMKDITAKIDAMGVATPDEVSKRGWAIRQVGVKAAEAPVAGAPAAPAAGKTTAAAPAAKMF